MNTSKSIYHNPIRRGFFPDPSVVRVGNDYYMVNSSFQYFPAIPISHSTDLINWEIIGHAITNSDYLNLSDIPDSHGIWAPDISYFNGKFYIFATLRLNGDGKRDNNVLRRQLVVTAENPAGPWSAPSWLEVDDIDPSHFVDIVQNPDGSKTYKHYMIIAPGVRAVELSDDCTKVVSEPIVLWQGTGERCPEGPHLLKKDDWYYAILAEGGTGYGHGINIARSHNFLGPYEPCPNNPVLRQKNPDAPLQRCGHGKVFQAIDGKWWCCYLCGRPNNGKYTTIGRETALDPVDFTDDGWFSINSGKGPSTENYIDATFLSKNTFVDNFTSPTLNKEWQFVRNPDKGFYSLTERPGFLRLWTTDGQLFERRAKNTLVHREAEHNFCATTKLEFVPTRDGEQAGLTCYYSTTTYIRFSLCYENGRKIQLVINKNHGEELIAEIPNIPLSAILLKVVVAKQKRSFFWSCESNSKNEPTWQFVGTIEPCTFLSDEGVPEERKRHTGTLTGIYANNGGCGSRICADFEEFAMN